jgi:hypothetical protein
MRKPKQVDISDLIGPSSDRTQEARVFLTELDKADRMAERMTDLLEIQCPHDEVSGKLERLDAMLSAICKKLDIDTEDF